jgi:hypothetical protein
VAVVVLKIFCILSLVVVLVVWLAICLIREKRFDKVHVRKLRGRHLRVLVIHFLALVPAF